MGKDLFKSKTFWLNIVGLGSTFVGLVPPVYAAYALAVLNIANRLLTGESIASVFGVKLPA